MKSFIDQFNFDDGHYSATVCVEGGECGNCGRGGQQFYCNHDAIGPHKLCEPCARAWCGVAQRREGESANIGSKLRDE